jgi:hypothetical protein
VKAAGCSKKSLLPFDSASPKSTVSGAIILQHPGNLPVTYQMTTESYNQNRFFTSKSYVLKKSFDKDGTFN